MSATIPAGSSKAETLRALEQAVIFEDSRFLVMNKPTGMAVHGGSGLSFGVIEGLRALRPTAPYLELVHRLDRDTSGCLLIAKRRSALRAFQKQQEARQVHKHYLALVKGEWHGGHRKVDAPLTKAIGKSGERIVRVDAGGRRSISFFAPLQRFTGATLMRVKLITGRTHQIRVHASHTGHPIAGDSKYGDAAFNEAMAEIGLGRLFLHASSIRFEIPEVATYEIDAPLDPRLEELLGRLVKL
ncbi:MAG: RluA family pseudouridine synthase [Zetaproteobacteria bacterium]|nr:RluA family pseudouridine synthase [Zetaproteobacteria bacterium]